MYHNLNSISKRLLPSWLYERLIGNWNSQGFKKYFSNTSWMFLAKIISFATTFLTISIVARYLGPENLGKLSYAQSFVSILSVFAALGIDQILYRDLVAHPEKENELLGTAISAKFFFGLMAFLSVIGLSFILDNEPILSLLIGITAFTFIINPLGTIGILFQAQVKAKYSSQVTIFLAILIPALKLLIIFFDKGIIYFSLILLVEAVINTLWSLYIYISKINHSPLHWRFSTKTFFNLISRSWPLLLVSLSGYIYGRIDQVMILHFLDSASVGFYDIAVRMSEFINYLPGIIIISVMPAIINAKKTSSTEYRKRFRFLITLCLSISFSFALITSLLAPYIITVLFGQDYNSSIPLLRMYSWSAVGGISLVLIQQYLIIENKSISMLIYSLSSAIINVFLNIILIPIYGMNGAIYATLGTLILTIAVFCTLNFKSKQ